MISGISGSAHAIQNAMERVDASAQRVSKVSDKNSNVDLTKEIPEMISTEKEVKLNIKQLQSQDEMIGYLLDIKK